MSSDLSGVFYDAIKPFYGTAEVESGVFASDTGLALTSDYTPGKMIRGLRVTGSGNLDVTYINGTRAIIPVVVGSNDNVLIKGELIQTIHSSATTTATGVFPLF